MTHSLDPTNSPSNNEKSPPFGMATDGSRALHWVLKIGNLKDSLSFFENVLGLRVLRHEEFDSGCEATCNGPYGGAWSKTMIGYGPEVDNFALELTYNYGIDGYAFGNDLQFIGLANPTALVRAQALNVPVVGNIIQGPDNYKYKIIPSVAGRAERFAVVGLRVSNLQKAKEYWVGILGLKEFPVPADLELSDPSTLVGFEDGQTKLQLIEVQDGQSVDHALSSGRIAFACKSVPPIFDLVTKASETVQTPPLTLPTPGKADVVVTILVDRDGYEICFVEDIGFYDLATPKYDLVDFAERATRGGDGAPPPGGDAPSLHGSGEIEELSNDTDEVAAKVAGSPLVVLDFNAGWCKNCKRIAPLLEQLAKQYADKLRVYSINITDSPDVAMEYDVSTLPRILFFKGGEKVDDYLGSSEAEITEKFAKVV